MTDNIPVNPATAGGKQKVATEKVGDIHYPVYKQAFGEDGETRNL